MSIRLNKAIRELNIGLQTAVEFLKKRSDLGEVRDDLSFKLSDSQYNALVEEFKSDKEVRNQAEKLLQKHPKEKKKTQERKEQKAENTQRNTQPQKYTVLGKIDLDSLDKKTGHAAQPRQQQTAGEEKASAVSQAPKTQAPKEKEETKQADTKVEKPA